MKNLLKFILILFVYLVGTEIIIKFKGDLEFQYWSHFKGMFDVFVLIIFTDYLFD